MVEKTGITIPQHVGEAAEINYSGAPAADLRAASARQDPSALDDRARLARAGDDRPAHHRP